YQGKHSIVRSNEMIFLARGQNRPPCRANAWVYDDDMHCSGGKIRIRLRNGKRPIQDIEGLDGMANIDNLRLRHNIQNDALHDAYKMVVGAEVGGQSDDRTIRQSFLAYGRHSLPRESKVIAGNRCVKA